MIDINKFSLYLYTCKMYALFSDGTSEDITTYLFHFNIEIDPITKIFPLINVKFKIDPKLILKIQNDNNIKFSLKIYKVDGNKQGNFSDIFLDTILISVLNDFNPVPITNKIEKKDIEKQYIYEIFECKLIPEECLNSNKTIVSGVYYNTTLLDVVLNISQKLNNKLYINNFDNNELYKQIILIPNNVFSNIKYLNEVYGFYKNGLGMFFGFNIFKIFDRNYYNIEEGFNSVYINFPINTNDTNFEQKSTREGNNTLIYTNVKDISFYNDKKLNQEVIGNNLLNFSINEKFNNTNKNLKVNNEINKTKMIINNYNNEMKVNEMFDYLSNSTDVQLFLRNLYLDINDIFKVYKFKFLNNLYTDTYDGNYIMRKIIIDFKKNKNGLYSMDQLLRLKKI